MSPEQKEKKIQNLYKSHNLSDEKEREIFVRKFFELLSEDIYQFPIKIFQFDEDEAGDFFLYAFEQLKSGKKLQQYEGKSRFFTWFFSVLRNLTIDFIRSKKNPYQKAIFFRDLQDLGKDINLLKEGENYEDQEKNLLQKLEKALEELKLDQKIIFKLAYLSFFEINREELHYLARLKNKSPEEIMQQILLLKEEGLKKLSRLRQVEEKLTANFQFIRHLELKLDSFFRENPHLPIEKDLWSEDYIHPQIPDEILEMVHQLQKRKKKQNQLLKEQKKKLYMTKIPVKKLAQFLESDPSLVAVQVGRITEKVAQVFFQEKHKKML